MKGLIEAVRVRKSLYDPSHEDYNKHKEKDMRWDEVAEEANFSSGGEAKNTWMKLRQSLRDALRRQQKCMKNGVEHFKLWKYQKEMEFLLPYMSSSLSMDGGSLLENDSETSSHHNFYLGSPSAEDDWADDTKVPSPPAAADKRKKGSREQQEDRKRQRTIYHPHQQGSEDNNRPLATMNHHHQPGGNDDGLYFFFMSMYETTRNMPRASQFVVRNDIFRVVTSVEATLMNIPTGPVVVPNGAHWPTHDMSDNE